MTHLSLEEIYNYAKEDTELETKSKPTWAHRDAQMLKSGVNIFEGDKYATWAQMKEALRYGKRDQCNVLVVCSLSAQLRYSEYAPLEVCFNIECPKIVKTVLEVTKEQATSSPKEKFILFVEVTSAQWSKYQDLFTTLSKNVTSAVRLI